MYLCVFSSILDPCNPYFHSTFPRFDKTRSSTCQTAQGGTIITDYNLNTGWYVLNTYSDPGTISTSCPPMNYCGTKYPAWYKGEYEKHMHWNITRRSQLRIELSGKIKSKKKAKIDSTNRYKTKN